MESNVCHQIIDETDLKCRIAADQERATCFKNLSTGEFFSIRRIEQPLELGFDTKNDWTVKVIYNYYVKVNDRSAFNFSNLELENITNRQEVFPQFARINFSNKVGTEYQLY